MPELPEVEIAMRGITPFLEGQLIRTCRLNAPALRYPFGADFQNGLEGKTVLALERRGKFILIHLDSKQSLIWHLGMSGRIRTFAPESDYAPVKHDHVLITAGDGQRIVYNDARRFGFMRLVPSQNWHKETHFIGMGPEPLGNGFNGPALLEALYSKTAPIKITLLDQRIVAGVGNIYASEALFESGISPLRPAGSLNEDEGAKLAGAIRHVLERAIASGGSSLRDYQHTDGSLGYFQHMFSVYDRAGTPCPVCSTQKGRQDGQGIIRITQGGRSTFYCPQCQK